MYELELIEINEIVDGVNANDYNWFLITMDGTTTSK
jgi:hypothetical protein